MMRRLLRKGEGDTMTVTDRLQANLDEAKVRLAYLETEAEGVERRIVLAALAGDAEEYVAAQMREAALPVLVNRAALAVVDAELTIVYEQKRGFVEELEEARGQYEPLHARRFALSRGEKREYGKAERALYGAEEKRRALEEREEPLLARKAELEEALAFRAAGKRAVEARQGFRVLRGEAQATAD